MGSESEQVSQPVEGVKAEGWAQDCVAGCSSREGVCREESTGGDCRCPAARRRKVASRPQEAYWGQRAGRYFKKEGVGIGVTCYWKSESFEG